MRGATRSETPPTNTLYQTTGDRARARPSGLHPPFTSREEPQERAIQGGSRRDLLQGRLLLLEHSTAYRPIDAIGNHLGLQPIDDISIPPGYLQILLNPTPTIPEGHGPRGHQVS